MQQQQFHCIYLFILFLLLTNLLLFIHCFNNNPNDNDNNNEKDNEEDDNNSLSICGLHKFPYSIKSSSSLKLSKDDFLLEGKLISIYPATSLNSEYRDGSIHIQHILSIGKEKKNLINHHQDHLSFLRSPLLIHGLPHNSYRIACRLQWLLNRLLIWQISMKKNSNNNNDNDNDAQFTFVNVWLKTSSPSNKQQQQQQPPPEPLPVANPSVSSSQQSDSSSSSSSSSNSNSNKNKDNNNAAVADVRPRDEITMLDSSSCDPSTCPPYGRCIRTSLTSSHCSCPENCPLLYEPVCGSDGLTHDNFCHMKRLSCLMNKHISQAYAGKCDPCKFIQCSYAGYCQADDNSNPRCLCPDVTKTCGFEPHELLCGSDNENYLSLCHMQAASCVKQMTITVFHKGGCKGHDPCANVACSFGAECRTVEASDEHPALAENSKPFLPNNNSKIIMTTQCSCLHLDCTASKYDPQCADDGRTFHSMCHLQRVACQEQISLGLLYRGACVHSPCSRVRCSKPYAACRVDLQGQAKCVCPQYCPPVVLPVCGSDGRSYQSVCHLRQQACNAALAIRPDYLGNCSDTLRCERHGAKCSTYEVCQAAPMKLPQAAPIQSSDSMKFECRCPECYSDHIMIASSADRSTLITEDQQVCGSDLITYRTRCHLLRAACVQRNVSLIVAHEGPCNACRVVKCKFYAICQLSRFGEAECICPTDCSYSPMPVCGSDGVTYENECRLKVVSCAQQKEINVTNSGSCRKCPQGCPVGEECVNGRCQCRQRCPDTEMRVCGTDGKYYRNNCELKRQACLQGATIKQDLSEASCGDPLYSADSEPSSSGGGGGGIDQHQQQQQCICNASGSISHLCDQLTQTCQCKDNVEGDRCDRCKGGFWGLSYANGCLACNCDPAGSLTKDCDSINGQCKCRADVRGRRCSHCVDSQAKLTNDGCALPPSLPTTTTLSRFIDQNGVAFKEESFMELQMLNREENHLAVNVTILPRSLTGTIFYLGDFSSRDHFTLLLNLGFIELHFDVGNGPLLLTSVSPLMLNKACSISAVLTDRRASLWIDGLLAGEMVSVGNMRNLNVDLTYAYLGRLPFRTTATEKQTRGILKGFDGCIGSVAIQSGRQRHYYIMESGSKKDKFIGKMRNIDLKDGKCVLSVVNVDIRQHDASIQTNKQQQQQQQSVDESEKRPAAHLSTAACSSTNPCKYGGTCVETLGQQAGVASSAYCLCPLGRQGQYCEHEVSTIAEFTGDLMLAFSPDVIKLRNTFTLKLVFLSTSSSGLILMISELPNAQGDYLRIALTNNRIEIACQTRVLQSVLRSDTKIQTHVWYSVTVKKGLKYLTLQVGLNDEDKGNLKKTKLVPSGWKKLTNELKNTLQQFHVQESRTYLGGYITAAKDNRIFDYSLGFRGAIQKLEFDNNNVALKKGESLSLKPSTSSNVQVTQWQNGPCYTPPSLGSEFACTPPLICVANYSKTSCKCSEDDGDSCHQNKNEKSFEINYKEEFMGDKPLSKVEESNHNYLTPLPPHIGRRMNAPIRFFGSLTSGKPLLISHLTIDRTHYNNIRFKYRTSASNGLQMLNLGKNFTAQADFLLLSIRDGFQETAINLGGSQGLLRIRSPIQVSDGVWHEVQVLRSRRRLTLIVDEQAIEGELNESSEEDLDTNNNLWIGGPPHPVSGFPWQYQMNFDGCVSFFMWNEIKVELSDENRNPDAQIGYCDMP